MTILGEDDDLAKVVRVLNPIVRWHPRKGITYEADPRHAEITCRDTGAEKLNTISTPAAKEKIRAKMRRRQDLAKEWQAGRQV